MGSPFQVFSTEFLKWGRTFAGLFRFPKVTKMGSIIGHKIDQKKTIMG